MIKRPAVYFYIPRDKRPVGDLPSTSETYWPWLTSTEEAGGRYAWTLQTYLYLRDAGFECELVDALPPNGIVVAHRDFLDDSIRPGPNLLLVCLLADRESPEWWGTGRHPYAQINVVQNRRDPLLTQPNALWKSHFMPLWPQPGLIPRDAARGDRFENAAFFGVDFAPELTTPTWVARLNDLGLRWDIVPRERWHDYRDIDVVVAVRSFDGRDYVYKPASKLYNAWHAGVPAVLGREAAYRSERKSDLDYLEVASVHEALLAVQRLRDDAGLRHAMVDNGRMRAQDMTSSRVITLWRSFLNDTAMEAHDRWCAATPLARHVFLTCRFLATYRRDALMRRGRALSYRLSRAALRGLQFVGGKRLSLEKWKEQRDHREKRG